MTQPLFISFYTPAYTEHAEGLRQSLNAFKLSCRIEKLDKPGTWAANCARKAQFISRMLRENPDIPGVVWLDADARVRQTPVLFSELRCDFAAHWREGWELLSGTMYFAQSDGSRRLLELWEWEQKGSPEEMDQRTLQTAWDRTRKTIRTVDLPPAYTLIFDTMKHLGPPVIEHLQASRQLKGMKQ